MAWRRGKFSLFAVVMQILFIALFAIFVEYGPTSDPLKDKSALTKEYLANLSEADGGHGSSYGPDLAQYYPMFQDVHVMIFVGFGFLMTFMRRYSFSSMGFNMLVGAFVIQWSTLMAGFLHLHDGKIQVDIVNLLTADFACATVLITFGAVLGRLSPLQMLVMALCEIAVFQVNEWVGLSKFMAVDVGGSMFVHVFGAYFGIAVAACIYHKGEIEAVAHKELPVYDSDIFSLIGTIFLWLFWPSFNAALASGDERSRAVINTYFALAGCAVVTFAFSAGLNKHDKIEIEHIQNATLAGGVAIGTVADMPLSPWCALLIGVVAGLISTVGFVHITPCMADRLRIHDSCGVNNLHGIPGLMAGVAGVIVAAMATEDTFGSSLYQLFPAMVPKNGTSEYMEFSKKFNLPPGEGRTATQQAIWQLIALGVTFGAAICGGIITGLILRFPIWNRPEQDDLFEDLDFWEVPDGYPPEPQITENEKNNSFEVHVITNEHSITKI